MNVNNMKRIYLFFLICFCASYSFAQEKEDKIFYYDTDWNKISSKKDAAYARLITFYENDLHHPVGLVKDYYLASGSLQWEGKFSYYNIDNEENNREQGKVTWYYENRQKSRTSYFDNGELYGVTKYWHENGELESASTYKDGKIEGTVERYNDNGNLKSRVEYKSGKLDGAYEMYYTNGNIKTIYRYENGKQSDKYAIEYDEYGACKMVAEDNFIDNKNNWRTGESNNGNSEYDLDAIKGEYSIISNADDGYIKWEFTDFGVNQGLDALAFSLSNYVVEATLKQVRKGANGTYGIFFGVKDSDNYMYFKIFESDDKVSCKVIAKNDGIFKDLSDWKEIDYFKKNDYNKFQIRQSVNYDEKDELESITFKFIINGYEVMESYASLLSGFNFGFGVSGSNTYLSANYLNIRYPCQGEYRGTEENQNKCKGSGTGFAINKQGYIATNFHVISDKKTGEICDDIHVTGINGNFENSYLAKVIIKDKSNDLAILKIEKWLGDIPYGFAKKKMDIAHDVYVLGYPLTTMLGKDIKFTNGKIGALTGFGSDTTYYQHSAPIQPGNSGGPLFNNKGDLIAINTLRVNQEYATTEGVFFSVKVRYLINLMEEISLSIPNNTILQNYKVPDQVSKSKEFVYLIEVGLTDIK
jgi:S1-C subfamily serine protease/antitoxin component YwqK of YwqJK toxin-antitoxin module